MKFFTWGNPWARKTAELVQIFPNSIEISKTTRGYTWTIKLRCNEGEEEKLINKVKELDSKLKKDFEAEHD